MLLAGHLDHAAALPLEEPQERVRAPLPRGGPADADPVEDQRQARPGAAPGVGAEHGVGADDVKVSGERREHGALRVLFDAEDVDEERGALEALGGQGAEDGACFSEVVLVLRLLRASAATPRPREKAPSLKKERKLLLRFFFPLSLSLSLPPPPSPADRIDVASTTTSGCLSQKSSASWKNSTPIASASLR